MYQNNCKKLIVAFCLAMVCACTSNPKNNNQVINADNKDTMSIPSVDTSAVVAVSSMEEIKKAYAQIKSAHQRNELDSISFKYNCDGERSGTVSYFTAKGILKMIVHRYAEYDHNEMSDSYFVNDNKPFFIYLRSLSWSFDSGPEGATKDKVTERRTYLSNLKAINCYEKKYEIQLHKGINPKPEDLPNKKISCEPVAPMIERYQQLAKYWKAKSPECLTF